MCTRKSHTIAFDHWFSAYLGQNQLQVQRLLSDGMATRFLIAWSLFESKCFNGWVNVSDLKGFAREVSDAEGFNRATFEEAGRHFHSRYQDQKRLRNLMHSHEVNILSEILGKPFEEIDDNELLFMLLIVVYRFRNNIFHGNKGVDTWLQYREQIGFCLDAMQSWISIREVT